MSKFSERVRVQRLNMNLSLRQLSKLTDISPSAIHAYENGKREASHQSLEALADVFNCDIDYLLGKTDIKNPVANALGFESLQQAYLNNALPGQQLSEGEQALIELFRKVPEDQQALVLSMIRAALNSK